jgi:hypothetical protein
LRTALSLHLGKHEVMQPGSKEWVVVMVVDQRGWVDAEVSVAGHKLLPACKQQPAEQALRYVEGALVDMHRGDLVEPSVHSPVLPIRTFHATSRSVALVWLVETLLAAVNATRLEFGVPAAAPATQTGTRLKLVPQRTSEDERKRAN